MTTEAIVTKNKAVGIDLGTTNSVISYYRSSDDKHGMPNAIKLGHSTIFPSCVMLRNGKFIVGKEAYENRFKPSVIYSVKRKMGTQELLTITDDVTGEVKRMTPVEVSAEILKAMLEGARPVLGEITEATITVPAYFTPNQKTDTYEAGKLAGLTAIHIINEPTSASLAYQLELEKPETALVFDLGGGTFDIAVVEFVPANSTIDGTPDFLDKVYNLSTSTKKSPTIVSVLDNAGNNALGGDDIDAVILSKVLSNMRRDEGLDIILSTLEREEALLKIEEFKKLNLGGSIGLSTGRRLPLTSDDIRFGYQKILTKCLEPMKPLLDEYKGRLDRIILVGGSTKSQYVSEYLKSYIGNIPIHVELNPDEAVGLGASVNTAINNKEITDLQFFDIVPETISIETVGGILEPIIFKGAMLPAEGSKTFDIVSTNAACIFIHSGASFASDATRLGYVELIPDDAKEKVTITLSVDLDSVLHIRAASKSKQVQKTLVRVSNLQPVVLSEDITANRMHSRRIANLTSILSEMEEIAIVDFPEAFLSEFRHALQEYTVAENKNEVYAKHLKLFNKATNRLAKVLGNHSAEMIAISLNTARGGELQTSDSDDEVLQQSKLFQ